MVKNIEKLLNPQSIAIIGASKHAGRIGGMPIGLLTEFGYQGEIYPSNPKYDEVFGISCWPDIESVPKGVDLAVLAIGAQDVLPMLKRCQAQGVKSAIVYAAGFAEEGSDEAVQMQNELTAFAQQHDMPVAGPNCMGFANLNTQAHTAFASVFKTTPMQQEPGRVSLLTQSGNVCAAVYALLRALDIPVSHFINTGNEATVTFADYLNYLADDDNTEVVIGYVEQIRDGPGFIKACQRLAHKNKVLIALKAGRTEKGAQAVQSHTSALAGDGKVYSAAFRQLGVIEAVDFAQMAQLAMLAELRDRSAGRRVAVVTMSGALGAILTDMFTQVGLQLPDLSAAVQEVLRRGIPSYGMVTNPVDVTGNIVNDPQFVTEVLESLGQSPELDVVVIYAPGYMLDRMAESLVTVAQKTTRLFVAIDTGFAQCRDELKAAGVAVFDDIAKATNALGPFLHWQERRQDHIDDLAVGSAVAGAAKAADALSLPLDEVSTLGLLSQYGLPVMDQYVAQTKQQAIEMADEIGYPVVLKVVSPDIAHKTEVNGVQVGIENAQQLQAAYQLIFTTVTEKRPDAAIRGVLVQPMQSGIAELIVGISTDPVFGQVLTLGLGGVLTEIYQDTVQAILPVSRKEIKKLLQQLTVYPLLDGFRGRPKADIEAVIEAVEAICHAAQAHAGQIKELEINPLLVKSKGVMALDALAVTFN